MLYGFYGKILHIDLSQRTSRTIEVSRQDVETWYLASGLAAKLLYFGHDPSVEPLAPEAPLLLLSGLFTGGPLPGTSKLSVCCRSPLTGIWNEATVGGHWPAAFRRTGWDGLAFTGRADKPVWLKISEEGVSFEDGADLWGLDAYQVEERLRPRLGEKDKIATIGPAGERGVEISSIIFDPPITRVAARAGVGAVMGAKHLKAVVVDGEAKQKVTIADREGLTAAIREDVKDIKTRTAGLTNFGTSGGIPAVEKFGDLPIKNWQLGAWEQGAKDISGQEMQPKWLDKHYSCYACPIRCGKIYRHKEKGLFGHGPEYETLGMLGANCLVQDPEAVIEGNELCNRYGIDTISAGAMVAFGIEAYERGLITRSEVGRELRWDADSMLFLVHAIGRGEGIGALLGRGARAAAAELGPAAEEFAVHTKGLEYPAHDPRGHVSMALNYATAVRGACHLEALSYFLDRGVTAPDFGYMEAPDPHRSDDKPPIVVTLQNYLSVFNPLGMCKFLFLGGVGPTHVARWLKHYADIDTDMAGVLETGERIFTLKRLYNCRLGISRKDDVLPPRLYAEAKPDGSAKGVLPDLGNMLYAYYQLRGWTTDGKPGQETLARLNITEKE